MQIGVKMSIVEMSSLDICYNFLNTIFWIQQWMLNFIEFYL